MAAAKKNSEDFQEGADVTVAPDDWEWDNVATEAPTGVIFEDFGDVFIGQYLRKDHIEREPAADGSDQSFDLFIFKGRDGELYALNTSYSLNEAMEDIEPGQWVRVTYVKNVKVGNWPTPMKSFRVDVRK